MIAGRLRPQTRWLLLLAIPAFVLAAGELAARRACRADLRSRSVELERLSSACRAVFQELAREALRTAERALAGGPVAARAQIPSRKLGARLDGVGIADARGELLDWEGSPADPCPPPRERSPQWRILVEGVRTSLVACTPPEPASGRVGVASFALDAPSPDKRLEALLPGKLRRARAGGIEFAGLELEGRAFVPASAVASTADPGPETELERVPIASPSGQPLATALFRKAPSASEMTRTRQRARAIAAVAASLLLAALFPWRSIAANESRSALVWAAVGLARAALLASRAPALLLPRELGSPTLFGTTGFGGALASPADLLLTCLASLLLAEATRTLVASRGAGGSRTLALPAAGAALSTAGLVVLSRGLARDARIAVLDLEAATESLAHAVLLLGLLLAVLSAAVFWAALVRGSFPRALSATPHRETAIAFASLLPLSLVVTAVLHGAEDRLALERLESEFAPKILDQAARRRLALSSAVTGAAESPVAARAVTAQAGAPDPYAAYRLWVEGDLYHAGFASSLDLYDASGALRSRFSFDLAPHREPPPAAMEPGSEPPIETERLRLGARDRWVQHAERPIVVGGRVVGAVVGHVVDEPDNLPFLPWVAPYLLALGPRSVRLVETVRGMPGYVRYDRDGAVVVTTVHRTPALTAELREAARRRQPVRLGTGGEQQIALPLSAAGDVHLLLLPARTVLDRAGAVARLLLLAAAALGLLRAAGIGLRAGGSAALLDLVRRSFYRKLLVSLVLASVLPVVALAFFLRVYVERRGQAGLVEAAAGLVRAVKRQVEDYAELVGARSLDDAVLSWLRRVIGQEIHLYTGGRLEATSKRELFDSGLLAGRLPGEVQRRVVRGGLPYLVREEKLGPGEISVAYARVELPGAERESVVAVPLILEQQEAARALDRVEDILLLATIVLCGLPAAAGAALARRAARPLRDLAAAASRIAAGDYSARLSATTRDEVAALVESFDTMAEALAAQREDLVRRREYMEALLRHATTGVVSTDARGRVVTVNPAAAQLLARWGAAAEPGQPLAESLERAPGLRPLARALADRGSPPGEARDVDLEHAGVRRRLRFVRVELPEPDRAAPGDLLLLDDVTELMRSNQLAAWAEMARAIAHEIKNPLTPIQLTAEHLRRILRDRGALPPEELEPCLETILKQVQALREISAEFSAYAKLPALDLRPTDPTAFLREVLAPYRAARPAGVEIEETSHPVPAVRVDARVLSRAVVNLIENALEAMPAGGVLRVGAEPAGDGTVALFVSDTGPGLDPAVRQRLFEPYFSTKSSGTGLGLAIARRAVEAHGGRIEVDSAPGRGTTFRILLPPA